MNSTSYLLASNKTLQIICFVLVVLIFAGYSLRNTLPYNFELIFLPILVWLGFIVFKKRFAVWNRDLFIWSSLMLLFYVSILLLNLIHSPMGEISVQKIRFASLIVGFVALGWLLYLLKPSLDFFWYFLMGASVLMLVWFAMELNHYGLQSILNAKRLGAAFGNPIKFGLFANTLFILMIGGVIWAYKKHPVVLLFWLFFMLANLLMVITSQTRTAWIGWPEALIGWGGYYFYLAYCAGRQMLLKIGGGIVLLIAVLASVNTNPISQVFEQRTHLALDNISDYIERVNPVTSVGIRLSMYETVIEMIKDKPYLGYGSDGFAEQFEQESSDFLLQTFNLVHPGFNHSHVHNQFLMTWVQYGLLPVILLLLIFVFLIRYFWQGMRSVETEHKPIFIAGLVFMIAMLMTFIPESPLEYASYSAHYWLFITLLFVFSLLVKESQKYQGVDVISQSQKERMLLEK